MDDNITEENFEEGVSYLERGKKLSKKSAKEVGRGLAHAFGGGLPHRHQEKLEERYDWFDSKEASTIEGILETSALFAGACAAQYFLTDMNAGQAMSQSSYYMMPIAAYEASRLLPAKEHDSGAGTTALELLDFGYRKAKEGSKNIIEKVSEQLNSQESDSGEELTASGNKYLVDSETISTYLG